MNLLDSKRGRIAAFGTLYFSEGLPGGFLMMAIATEIQRRGMETGAYGPFIAILALPWIWKFFVGPFVDNIHFNRFGARKQWIIMAQTIMILALIAAMFNMPQNMEVTSGEQEQTEEAVQDEPPEDTAVVTAVTDSAQADLPEENGEIVSDESAERGFREVVTDLYLSGIILFAGLLFLHNFFAATQDVAIDALACQVLKEDERGLANGMMQSCSYLGYLVGGSGVLWLKSSVGGFEKASIFVLILMCLILSAVVIFIREKTAAQQIVDGELPAPKPGVSALRAISSQIYDYFVTIWQSVFKSRNGFIGILLALSPIGALALTMLLSGLIAPRLGMTDKEIAALNTASTVVFFPFCLIGGWLSDRFGRRLILGITATLTILPSLWIAFQFKEAGWAHPPNVGADGMWPREAELITSWWIAVLTLNVFFGLSAGVKTALFMDITNPKIAATQFTAMMALMNLTNIYSKVWQSWALDIDFGWKWPIWRLLYVDSALGLIFLIWLFLLKPRKREETTSAELA